MTNVTAKRIADEVRELLDRKSVLMVEGSIAMPMEWGNRIKSNLEFLLRDRNLSVADTRALFNLLDALIDCAKEVGYTERRAAMDAAKTVKADN